MKRTHGLTLNNKLYLCTLADLPCIIEAQKTLDYSTFYKSCDASQIMYVHNTCLDNMQGRTQEEVQRFVAQFCPLDDEDFKMDLYQRKKLQQRVDKWREDPAQFPLNLTDLRLRHGLSPASKNIRNVRHKVDPIVDKKTVHRVEVILRSLIETGFAENCDEELLEFDDEGNLVRTIKGITEEQR